MSETASLLHELESRLQHVMLRDRSRLKQQLEQLRQRLQSGSDCDQQLTLFQQRVSRSVELTSLRQQSRPGVTRDPGLPITAAWEEIAQTLLARQVIVVCGETGSGKSTQLPKLCLEQGRGILGLIGHTQPRRLAARSIASRIAEELNSRVGDAVGFKIRFTDTISPRSYIKLMTDGILLAETRHDHDLQQYDTIIVDEAHERSLNIDFLLGYLKRLLPRRPDLRVIITSATIDVERFAEFFTDAQGPAPVIEVSGRTYPVEVRYLPPELEEADDGEIDWIRSVADACERLAAEGPGDILVFMPTERDIRETCKVLRGRAFTRERPTDNVEIVPLFGRLSEAEQHRIFQPHGNRRIVVATNVAESSLTVPGIHYVVDPGLARISRFSAASKVQRLPIEPISQASADQRKGRCGRVAPGICVRLYSEQDYLSRERFTPPEILRTNLSAVLLQMKSLNLGRVEDFPFLDPPRPGAVRGGLKTLFELGAIDSEERLTPLGRALAKLPVDPSVGRMILAGIEEGCLDDVLVIAAALEHRDPRERPLDRQQQADEAHARFLDETSDFVTLLNLWQFYSHLDRTLSTGKLRKACHQNFLSYNRMREWCDLHHQLRHLTSSTGFERCRVADATQTQGSASLGDLPPGRGRRRRRQSSLAGSTPRQTPDQQRSAPGEPVPTAETTLPRQTPESASGVDVRNQARVDALHRAILAGMLSHIGMLGDAHEYTGAGGQTFFLWPGSVAFRRKPKWIVAAELVETTRRYARCVAPVQPEWIERLAAHLIKRTYSEPHWSRKSATVMAYEKVLIYGLPIVSRRLCRYGPIDPRLARELFIRHGLVEGDYRSRGDFVLHNQMLKEELSEWQAKLRQTSLFQTEEAEVAFFDRILPADVIDGPSFEAWRQTAEREEPELLWMRREDLLVDPTLHLPVEDFPDILQIGSMRLKLEYHLDPGGERDGVTLIVPREGINQLSPSRLEWLVPGLITEKITALIKTLPKELRRLFVPAPQTARELLPLMRFGEGDLLEQLSTLLRQRAGEHVPPAAFDISRLPDHLRMNIRVVDSEGHELATGRELPTLREQLAHGTSCGATTLQEEQWHRDGIVQWNFGDLPVQILLHRGGVDVTAYPMLVDAGTSVSIRLSEHLILAENESRRALVRLLLLSEDRRIAEQVRHFPKMDQLQLLVSTLPGGTPLRTGIAWRIAERTLFGTDRSLPRSPAEWSNRLKKAKNHLGLAVQDMVALMEPLLTSCQSVRRLLDAPSPPALRAVHDDLKAQWDELFAPDFFTLTPWGWLIQYPRYLQAMEYRWKRAGEGGFQKDQQRSRQIAPWVARYGDARVWIKKAPELQPLIDSLHWLIEEYRVSLTAQHLKTAVPVSEKRLQEVWEHLVAQSRPCSSLIS